MDSFDSSVSWTSLMWTYTSYMDWGSWVTSRLTGDTLLWGQSLAWGTKKMTGPLPLEHQQNSILLYRPVQACTEWDYCTMGDLPVPSCTVTYKGYRVINMCCDWSIDEFFSVCTSLYHCSVCVKMTVLLMYYWSWGTARQWSDQMFCWQELGSW